MALSVSQRRQLDIESPLKLSILSGYGDLGHVFLPLTVICSTMVDKNHQAEKISTPHAKTAALFLEYCRALWACVNLRLDRARQKLGINALWTYPRGNPVGVAHMSRRLA